MKRALKYTIIISASLAVIYSSYYIGVLRGLNLENYLKLEQLLYTVNALEKGKTEEVKKSLNSSIDLSVILLEEANEYWLVPVDDINISSVYARISRYRKFSGYEYKPDSSWLKTHERANKIIYAK